MSDTDPGPRPGAGPSIFGRSDAGAAGPDGEPELAPVCSARGCTAAPTWKLLWNNPKLHTPERRKVWLACDVHRETLGDFLGMRGMLKDTVPFDQDG